MRAVVIALKGLDWVDQLAWVGGDISTDSRHADGLSQDNGRLSSAADCASVIQHECNRSVNRATSQFAVPRAESRSH